MLCAKTWVNAALLTALLSPAHAAPSHAAKPHPARPKVSKPVPAPIASYGVTLTLDKPVYAVPAEQNSVAHMRATLTLFNRTSVPLKLLIGGQQYDWQILSPTGDVLWDYAKGRRFPHFLYEKTLVNDKLSYTDDIPLTSQDGVPLAPGSYTLRGSLPHALNASATVGFTVTR